MQNKETNICTNCFACLKENKEENEEKEYYKSTIFLSACILEGLEYLHSLNILYLNLTPEDILLDKQGYPRLSNIENMVYLGNDKESKSVYNVSHLVAPEITLTDEYSYASDYWNFGLFMYFIYTGKNPFFINDYDTLLNIIKRSCDESFKINFPQGTLSELIDIVSHLLVLIHTKGLDLINIILKRVSKK